MISPGVTALDRLYTFEDLAFDGEFLYEYGNTLTGEIRKAGLRIPATTTLF